MTAPDPAPSPPTAPRSTTGCHSPTSARASAATRCCSSTATRRRSASGGATSRPLADAGLRGDRARPARLRRLATSRPTDLYDIVAYARDLHALVHDVLGHERCGVVGRRPRRRGRLRPRAAASRLRRAACACSTPCRRSCARSTQAAGIEPTASADATPARRPTTSSARAASPTRWPPSSTPPSAAAGTSRDFYGHRLWAAPRHVRPRRRRLHDRAVRRRATSCARAGPCYETAIGNRPMSETCRACSRRIAGPDAGALRPRGPRRSRATSSPAARWRSPSASARSSCPAPGTSCSGSGPTCSTGWWPAGSPSSGETMGGHDRDVAPPAGADGVRVRRRRVVRRADPDPAAGAVGHGHEVQPLRQPTHVPPRADQRR